MCYYITWIPIIVTNITHTHTHTHLLINSNMYLLIVSIITYNVPINSKVHVHVSIYSNKHTYILPFAREGSR